MQFRRPGFNPWVGKIPWRREWQPTPVFLPGEFQGQGSMAGYSPQVTKSWTRLSNFHFHFCFTILCWFLPYINMNQLQVYVCPHPPNFHPILPLPVVRDHWIWAPCAVQKTFIGYLILHMVMYMFQCCSLNSSHPFLPLLCPEVCSLCLHLYCCPPHRLISTIFLDSICKC